MTTKPKLTKAQEPEGHVKRNVVLDRHETEFLLCLPQDCRTADPHPRVPGSTMKAKMKRWGLARFSWTVRNTGWMLTELGRAAVNKAEG